MHEDTVAGPAPRRRRARAAVAGRVIAVATKAPRFFLDKDDPNILHDVITVIDHALTRPWTADKRYRRNPNLRAQWPETYCNEGNANVVIGKENYFMSGDGFLMPAKKNQAPPDLKYFKQTQK
jgi:hypothetical protein